MEATFLTNQRLEEKQIQTLVGLADKDDPILFAVVGEISKRARYSLNVLLVTRTCLFTYDFGSETCSERIYFSETEELFNKRMYGNALMRARMKDGTTREIFRFTFTVTAICDAVLAYVTDIRDGNATPEEAFDAIRATYEKHLSVCPKCGRTLSAPGVPCINCMGKSRLLKKLGVYLKPQLPIILVSIILSFVTTGLALTPPMLTKQLVDDILPNSRLDMLYIVSFSLVGVYIARFLFSALRTYIARIAGNKIVAAIRCDVYEKAQHLPMRFYDKTSTGAVINRISGDTATLQAFMLRITQDVLVYFFRMIGIVVVMLCMNWKLTLFSLVPVPIVVIGSRIFRKKIAPFYRRIWRRSSAVTSVLTDTIPGIRVIKSFTNEKKTVDRFSACVDEWRVTDTKAGKILSIYPQIVNIMISCGSVVIWALGGQMVIGGIETQSVGAISVGLLVSFITYANMFYEPVNFFANLSDSAQNAMASAERIMDILDAEPEHDFGKGNTNADIGGRIEFKNVNFSFDRTKKVLKNINLVIEPGDIVGIVGTTGSGKSTLINLLLRYYDHYEGQILVGGVDIRDIDMQYYRSHIGYVQQEPMMFHDTIYNNIAYGDDSFSVDEVINAADIANAHEFIIRQPDGYDSMLGERGVGLSGGERQRISIARAMLRNPKMLVFDEATASVDSETEHLIQDAIEHLISGRTTLMIAHRLSTLSKANKIVVVDNGAIIECGTPEELMELKGKYYRLVQIQSMSDKVAKERRAENFE
ncbi:MAG: ABC transporter ATP-binding protein [Ruminococcaceae bacterium]|nr:ABC transporter ATP-binding protein [Oscillospiraceae bacterium]